MQIPSDDAADAALVNGRSPFHNGIRPPVFFKTGNDLCLLLERDLRIWDNGRQKKRVGMTTVTAFDTTDTKGNFTFARFDVAEVIAMYSKASGMSAGTGQLMELDTGNSIIVKSLGYGIAIIDS